MIIGAIEEYLPWAHKHQLPFLFYHRDHRNSLNKNGKNNNFTAAFSQKLN